MDRQLELLKISIMGIIEANKSFLDQATVEPLGIELVKSQNDVYNKVLSLIDIIDNRFPTVGREEDDPYSNMTEAEHYVKYEMKK